MILIFLYYLIAPLRPFIFILFACYLFSIIKCRKRIVVISSIIFLLSLIIQVINLSLHHFLLFLLIGPSFAYWVYKSKFELSILRNVFLLVQIVLFLLFLKGRTFINVFAGLSENYVSVLMVCYVILIACIELRQNEKVSIIYSMIGLFLSLLTLGRSGIVCSFVLLCLLSFIRFSKLSPQKRNVVVCFFLFVGIFLTLKYYNSIIDFFYNFELFNKFQERGLKSPSRGILIDEYFSHIDLETFFCGYRFERNSWFIHYGLNPHNSFIRLHYQIGFVAIIIFTYVITKLFNFLKMRQIILMFFLLIMIIRAYTDVYLFFGFYDFLLYYIVFVGDGISKQRQILKPIKFTFCD